MIVEIQKHWSDKRELFDLLSIQFLGFVIILDKVTNTCVFKHAIVIVDYWHYHSLNPIM